MKVKEKIEPSEGGATEPTVQPAGWMDRVQEVWNPYQPERLASGDLRPAHVDESHIRKSAARMLLVAMVLFLVWAVYAPIDAGVSVPGTVVVYGNRKAVQHPQGGVVQAILIREGATVKQGDVLLKINPLNTEADLTGYELQYINLLATEARLLAERAGRPDIAWKPELERLARDPRVIEAKAIQGQLFRSRLEDQRGQQDILKEQIAGLQAQVEGLQGMLKERRKQLVLLEQDAKSNRELAEEGYVPRRIANDLARSVSDAAGNIASTEAELAKTRAAIAATRLQLVQLTTNYLKDIDTQLSDAQKSREALQTKVASLRFQLQLTDLRAPVSGTVVGLKTNTVGGVVQPGQTLMEIVPAEENLIVEGRVPPTLIDKVKVGLQADLRFTAFNLNTTPIVPGLVTLVGADKIKPEGSQDEVYLSQIQVTPEGKKMLGSLAVQPGMPVDVMIKTGERSFMSYIVKPITDRFAWALKEQ
jgi:protease secretion system membrane fusion protein